MRKLDIALVAGGIVLVAGALLTRFVAYPAVTKVPSNLDIRAELAGTATVLDQSAMAPGSTSPLFKQVDARVTRAMRVTHATDDTAVVSDDLTVTVADGSPPTVMSHTWAISRTDGGPMPAPQGWKADEHEGLVVNLPTPPREQDYTYWDAMTAGANPLVFVGRQTIGDRASLGYRSIAEGKVAEQSLVAALPPALPSMAVLAMAQNAPGSTASPASLTTLPPIVPLSYDARSEVTLWVDEATGIALKVEQKQAVLAVPAGTDLRIPLNAVDVASTEASITDSTDQARTVGTLLWWIGIGGPVGLGVLGSVLLVVAVVRIVRVDRGRQPTPVAAPA